MKNNKYILALSPILLCSLASHAGVIFDFNYTDFDTGFNDPVYGADRRAALTQAASEISDLFVNYNATIQMDVDGSASGDFLAAAGSSYSSPHQGAGFNDRGDVMLKILGYSDPDPSSADGTVIWNFLTYEWELGSDFQAGEYDFISTAKHELLHTLGFASSITQDGSDAWGNAAGTAGSWAPFDEFVADQYGYLIDGSYVLAGDAWGVASVGGAGENGLMFIGENAMAANGNNAVYLYSPTTWEEGSSGSHVDDDIYSGVYMMEAATSDGLSTREISNIEIGILKDIGYNEIIPEPSALALIGFAGVGVLIARRFQF